MKKLIFLLNIDNYAPEITAITYPLIERYAKKIGAEIHRITERKFPEYPPVYEKLQIYELAKNMDYDWYIYIDSDALIHPELFDITEMLNKDEVFQVGSDFSPIRFKKNKYMLRDGRNIGTCNWFTIFSDWSIDLFNPDIGMTREEIIENCFVTEAEKWIFDRTHLVDDYILATNVARYGLKYRNWQSIPDQFPRSHGSYFYHEYLISKEEKIKKLGEMAKNWLEVNHIEEEKKKLEQQNGGSI